MRNTAACDYENSEDHLSRLAAAAAPALVIAGIFDIFLHAAATQYDIEAHTTVLHEEFARVRARRRCTAKRRSLDK